MNYQVSKMRLTMKKVLQALVLVVLFSLSSLAVLRLAHYDVGSSVGSSVATKWMGRIALVDSGLDNNFTDDGDADADRDTDYLPPVSVTAKPFTTTLDDLFISVKTTKNFHNSRLDVIIRTWFTLARDQVNLI